MYIGAHAAQIDLKALDKMDGPHFKVDRDPAGHARRPRPAGAESRRAAAAVQRAVSAR